MLITAETIEEEAAQEEIRALDLACFAEGDLLNILLQRSEIITRPRPRNRAVAAWADGDEGPLRDEVQRLGPEIARRAAAIARLEWADAQALLDRAEAAPVRIADIGCGYAMTDLFALRAGALEVLLIDIEAGGPRVFGYEAEGAAYASLPVARAFLEANGIAPGAIATCNPAREDLAAAGPVDMAASFLSCGFHYPAATYSDFFAGSVRPGGHVMLDLRARAQERQQATLAAIGPEVARSEGRKFVRVLHRRA